MCRNKGVWETSDCGGTWKQFRCFFFFKLIYFNWRLITLQYCSEHCILMVKNRLMFSKGNCYGGAENMNDESNRHAFIS